MHITGLLALCMGLVVSCTDRAVHPFVAMRFDPDEGCLEKEEVLDVVDGAEMGSCQHSRCWHSPSGDVFVTTTACDAPADYAEGTWDPTDSLCAAALQALETGTHCEQ